MCFTGSKLFTVINTVSVDSFVGVTHSARGSGGTAVGAGRLPSAPAGRTEAVEECVVLQLQPLQQQGQLPGTNKTKICIYV